ncbi:sigma-70 family RNA polymerase sigma factor [Catenulispora subtropica]|uniref:RNA polymerase sigma factor n=1 Tax=Catenulispora subtropica TaxID=450798 RepID=A0ABN2R5M5_9ACTN
MDLEAHRAELTAYCYRMLGSVHDAEDLVQETLLRAWKARDQYDSSRASVRTWLYRIATNVCLTALESRKRRPLPSGIGAASRDTEAPLKPALDVPWLEPFPDSRFSVEARADLRLAWVAAVQDLPARQRAVLVLRDVLEFSASEVAEQLDTTVASVNSALQRARVTVRGVEKPEAVREADDPEQRAVVERYLRAFEDADVPALVRLLADDVIMEMPPVPLWYQGRDDYARFMERVFRMVGTGWSARLTTANGQPAMAAYAPDPAADGGHRAHTLQVFSVAEGLVTANVVFAGGGIFETFGLPAVSGGGLAGQ